jgi:hypothetical protein
MQAWQDAIAMIDGTNDVRKNERIERSLLEKELRRNGTSMKASQQILNNLDRYNKS